MEKKEKKRKLKRKKKCIKKGKKKKHRKNGKKKKNYCQTKKDAFGVKIVILHGDDICRKPKFIGFKTWG